jgi:hypothetical protein
MFKRMLTVSLGSMVCFSALPAQQPAGPQASKAAAVKKEPTGKVNQGSKLDLTPETLPKLLALVRPQDDEFRHLRVHWLTDPVAALKKAAAEDKPLVFLELGGAGYNEPLGAC